MQSKALLIQAWCPLYHLAYTHLLYLTIGPMETGYSVQNETVRFRQLRDRSSILLRVPVGS
jgi:hypothetical protein